TEFNRFQSSSAQWTTAALDNAQHAAEYGSIFPQAMGENVYGMYAFKFGQTLWDNDENGSTPDGPPATGVHFLEDSGAYSIKGATRGGEVMRMVIKAFKGQRPRMATNLSAANANYEAATSEDAARGKYYYYAVNRDTTNDYSTTVDLSSWDVAANQIIAVQE